MGKKFIWISLLILLFSCKTKTVQKSTEKEETKTTETVKKETIVYEKKDSISTEKKSATIDKYLQDEEQETEIEGHAETDRPFLFTQTKNGNIVQSFEVIGNAKIKLKTTQKNSNIQETRSDEKAGVYQQQNTAASSVKEKNKKTSETEKITTEKNTKTVNGTFGTFASIIICFAVVAVLVFLFIYFKNYRKKSS